MFLVLSFDFGLVRPFLIPIQRDVWASSGASTSGRCASSIFTNALGAKSSKSKTCQRWGFIEDDKSAQQAHRVRHFFEGGGAAMPFQGVPTQKRGDLPLHCGGRGLWDLHGGVILERILS